MNTFGVSQNRRQIVGAADVYIPRINKRNATHAVIGSVFVQQNIGYIDYIDFVEINANHPPPAVGEPLPFEKHPTLISAFLKIVFWDKKMLDAIQNGSSMPIKIYPFNDSEEHWLVLPNKSSAIERTSLNIHQIAHYTSEVQTKTEELNKLMETIARKNEELAQTVEILLKQNRDMRAEIEELKAADKHESKTVISIVHNARDNIARKTTSDCLCGNA